MDKIKSVLVNVLKNKKILAVMIVVIAVIGFLLWRKNKSATQTQTVTAKVEKGTIVSTISTSGNVLSANISSITTQASGVIKNIYVKEGDKVKAGQKIAEVELDFDGAQQSAQAYASYVSAQNSVNSANNSLRGAQASLDVVYDEIKGHDTDETLAQKETRTKAEVAKDNAYISTKSAAANLISASYNLRLNSGTITAPTSGTITSLTIAEGVSLSSQTSSSGTRTGQRIGSISTSGKILVSVNISEIDVPKIKLGQGATVSFDSLSAQAGISDKTFTGKVVSVDRVGSTTSNVTNYPAIIALDTSSDQILPNMAATANIIIEVKNNVLLVPSSAVKQQSGQTVVEVIKSGQPQSVNVETGLSSDSQTEIVYGLSEGDEVVTSTTSTSGQSGSSVFGRSGGSFGGAGRAIFGR